MGRPCGQLMGQDVAASARSSQSILAGSRRMLILMAARQAMRRRHGAANVVERGARAAPARRSPESRTAPFRFRPRARRPAPISRPPCGCRTARSRSPARPAPRRCARIRSAARRSGRSPGAPAAAGSRCRRWRAGASTCSNRIRSCATCWSMIHNPSRPAAMMKLSWIWPSGRRSVERVQAFGIERLGVGEQRPVRVGYRRASAQLAEPARSRIAARAKAARRRMNSGRVSADSAAVAAAALTEGKFMLSMRWLNSEYGSPAPGCGGVGAGIFDAGPLGHQDFANRIADEIMHHRSVPESHFGLGGMHVHVHLFGVAIQKQQREGITRRRHQVVIRGRNRVQQQAVANQPAVDEQVNRIAVELLHLRTADESPQPEAARELRLVRARSAYSGRGRDRPDRPVRPGSGCRTPETRARAASPRE